MIADQLKRRDMDVAQVDAICALNAERGLDGVLLELDASTRKLDDAGRAAVLACLGDANAHARVLEALTSARDRDMEIAQVYLRYRPIADVSELRAVAAAVARMRNAEAQVRALDTLAGHRLADRESLDVLTGMFPTTKSLEVQRAIAGILIRADYNAFAKPELVRALQQHRVKSSDGRDLIDVLIHRLQANLQPA